MTCVASASDITTCAEAKAYYLDKLAGSHSITCHGQAVDIVFERNGTHVFSKGLPDKAAIDACPIVELVTRDVGGGGRECRRFLADRAKLMDCVLPAISKFERCVIGKAERGRPNREVYGPKMPCGRHMKVVLREGPKKAWICVTAFPVTVQEFRQSSWHKVVPFP